MYWEWLLSKVDTASNVRGRNHSMITIISNNHETWGLKWNQQFPEILLIFVFSREVQFMSQFVVFLSENRSCGCSLPEEQRWDGGAGAAGIPTATV